MNELVDPLFLIAAIFFSGVAAGLFAGGRGRACSTFTMVSVFCTLLALTLPTEPGVPELAPMQGEFPPGCERHIGVQVLVAPTYAVPTPEQAAALDQFAAWERTPVVVERAAVEPPWDRFVELVVFNMGDLKCARNEVLAVGRNDRPFLTVLP